MSIEAGTPRFGQKIAVALGLGHLIGLTDAEIASVKEGEGRDATAAEAVLFDLLGPLIHQDVATLEADVASYAVDFLTKAQTVTSLPQLAAEIEAAAATDAPQVLAAIRGMAQAAGQALVGLALVKAGKALPPT